MSIEFLLWNMDMLKLFYQQELNSDEVFMMWLYTHK